MTAAEWIARARTVTDGATPGPWWREGDNEYVYGMARGGRPNGEGIATAIYYGQGRPDSRADAEFIAASRTLLPAAVAAIEAVLAHLEGLTETVGHEVWPATDLEPEECTDECPACEVEMALAVLDGLS